MSGRYDVETWMWLQASERVGRAERMHRQFFGLAAVAGHEAAWEPPADVFEGDREVVVTVALPGVAPSQLRVGLDGGALVVQGRRPLPALGATVRVRRLEIPHGVFARRVELPDGVHELLRADLADGCLTATLRKHPPGAR